VSSQDYIDIDRGVAVPRWRNPRVRVSPAEREPARWRAIDWTPRTTALVVALIHAVIFLGIFKLRFRVTGMTYYELGSDTQHVYWPAVQKLLAGHIPYVDPRFFVEYPPLGSAFFLLPALLHPTSLRAYDWLFAAQILAVDIATLPLIARLARRQQISATAALAAYGLAIPLLGALVSQRYDLVPATLTLGAILALLDRRSVVAWVLLLLATLMKLYPAVLAPLFLLYEWRPLIATTRHWADWRTLARRTRGIAVYALGLAGSTLAWRLLAPDSLARFIEWETRRGIEIESVWGSLAELAHLGVGLPARRVDSYGSYDVASSLSPTLKLLSTLVTLVLLAAIYVSYARRLPSPPDPLSLAAGEGERPSPPGPLSLAAGEGERPVKVAASALSPHVQWEGIGCDPVGRLPSPASGRAGWAVGPRLGPRDQFAWGGGEGRVGDEDSARLLVTYATLAILAVLLGSKLLSIQFLLWLLPLLVVQPRRPRRAAAFALAVVLLSQWIYPMHWNDLWNFKPGLVLQLALRNALLVTLFILLWRDRAGVATTRVGAQGPGRAP